MRSLYLQAAAILIVGSCVSPARSQLLPSQAKGAARAQIVMLSVNGGCAAGIVVGYDEKAVYIATAAHIADLSTQPFPPVAVKFEGLSKSPSAGKFWPQFEQRDQGDLAVVTVGRDDSINKLLDQLDFAVLSPVPLGAADTPVTSIGCFGGAEWSSGSNETLLTPEQGYVRFQSDVGEGQSGGGLYNEAWELIAMPLAVGPNGIFARPIAQILEDISKWGVPVRLAPRARKDRVRGADEVARENAAIAKSRELAYLSAQQLRADPSAALRLAIQAMDASSTSEAESALRRAVPEVAPYTSIKVDGPVARAQFAAGGRIIVTLQTDRGVRLFDAFAKREIATPAEFARSEIDWFDCRPDGDRMVVRRQRSRLEEWDVRQMRLVVKLDSAGASELVDPVYAPSGQEVLARSRDGTVFIWNVQSGRLDFHQKLSDGPLLSLLLTPDGKILLGHTANDRLLLWNRADGRVVQSFGDDHHSVADIFLTPLGDLLVCHYRESTGSPMTTSKLIVLRIPSLETVFTREVSDSVPNVAVAPDGKHIAFSDGNAVQILNSQTGAGSELPPLQHDDKVYSLAYTPDGRSLVTCGKEGIIRIWSADSRMLTYSVKTEDSSLFLQAVTGSSRKVLVLPFENNNKLILCDLSHPIAVTLKGHGIGVLFVEFSPDGKYVLTGGGDGVAALWDAETGVLLRVVGTHTGLIRSASFSPNGKLVVTAGEDGLVALWSLTSEDPIYVRQVGPAPRAGFSPDGRKLFVISNHTANLVDVATGTVLHSWNHDYVLDGAVFDAPSRRLVTICPLGEDAFIWDVETFGLVSKLPAAQISKAAFSPDGKLIATAGGDGMARLWRVADGAQRSMMSAHLRRLTDIEFSPDGSEIATTSEDGTARVWKSPSGTPVHVFIGHGSKVNAVAFSPNGKILATAGSDGTVRLWDVDSGGPRSVLEGHTLAAWKVRFSPDGTKVVSASLDKTARINLVDAAQELKLARLILPSTVTLDYSSSSAAQLAGKYEVDYDDFAAKLLASKANEIRSLPGEKPSQSDVIRWARQKGEEIVCNITIEPDGTFSMLFEIKGQHKEDHLTGSWKTEGKRVVFELHERNGKFESGLGSIDWQLENGRLQVQLGKPGGSEFPALVLKRIR